MRDTRVKVTSLKDLATSDGEEQLDLFAVRFDDPPIKADIHSLEFPFFVLSKHGSAKARVYEKRGVQVEIIPSSAGAPTQWDKDILIYAATNITAALTLGHSSNSTKTVRFPAYDLLRSTGRGVTGRDYQRLESALIRLRGAVIRTSIATGGHLTTEGFGFIESYSWRRRQAGLEGFVSLTVSDWFHRAIVAREILTLNRAYFELESSLARRLYEIVRKHCGIQSRWKVSLRTLKEKTGSAASDNHFRLELRRLVGGRASRTAGADRAGTVGRLLEYLLWLSADGNLLTAYGGADAKATLAAELATLRQARTGRDMPLQSVDIQ